MTSPDTHGHFHYNSSLRLPTRYKISTFISSNTSIYPSSVCNVIMVKNLTIMIFDPFFLLKGLFCAFLAPTIHPKMAKSNVVSAPSLTSCTLIFQAHLKPSYWLKHCTLPHTYPTDVLVARLIFLHHMKHSISSHLIILTSGPSVAYVSQILVPQTLTNYLLAPLLAHSLVIHVSTKATGASTSAPTKSSLPGT
jgi:hypothetical protein